MLRGVGWFLVVDISGLQSVPYSRVKQSKTVWPSQKGPIFFLESRQRNTSLRRSTFQKSEDLGSCLVARILIILFQWIYRTRGVCNIKIGFETLLEIPCVKWYLLWPLNFSLCVHDLRGYYIEFATGFHVQNSHRCILEEHTNDPTGLACRHTYKARQPCYIKSSHHHVYLLSTGQHVVVAVLDMLFGNASWQLSNRYWLSCSQPNV
jgi:hypothetical protein